jgi:L-alanine-DL-glutamate epimerase-like enolase superfamily enzyme
VLVKTVQPNAPASIPKVERMSVRIIDIKEITKPISSPIRNAYIDFTKMTTSLVAVVTDAVRDGKRVVGYGFNSNGRYGQGGLIRERFAPRLMEADPAELLDETGEDLDPDKVWAKLMSNEKPGGHGERSVAVGTIDMAVWDAVAKIAGKPLFRLLADRHGRSANPRVFVYAAGAIIIRARTCRCCVVRCAAISTAATMS